MRMTFNQPKQEKINVENNKSASGGSPQETKATQVSTTKEPIGLKVGGKLFVGGNTQPTDAGKVEKDASVGGASEQENTKKQQPQQQQNTGIDYSSQKDAIPETVIKDFEQSRVTLTEMLEENTEMIGYALRRIMVDLKSHPELAEFLRPEDMGNMVRALRVSYGNALVIKEKKSRGKKKKSAESLGDLGIDLGDLDVTDL